MDIELLSAIWLDFWKVLWKKSDPKMLAGGEGSLREKCNV